MQLNPDIDEILKEFKINRSEGFLFLLGVYHDLDVDKVCSESLIKAMNMTKIVERDYHGKSLQWNMPLYLGEETGFGWVKKWIEPFGVINPDRLGSWQDSTARMKLFFQKYPEYRKEDVYKARDLYFSTIRDPQFLMKSHKFIFEGMGAMKASTLLQFCQRVSSGEEDDRQKGKIVT